MSHTTVLVSQVKSACKNYSTWKLNSAEKLRETLILEEINNKFFGKFTRERAIKNLNNSRWPNWQWEFAQEDDVQSRIDDRTKGLLAMCDLSITGTVVLSSKDCNLVNNFKD